MTVCRRRRTVEIEIDNEDRSVIIISTTVSIEKWFNSVVKRKKGRGSERRGKRETRKKKSIVRLTSTSEVIRVRRRWRFHWSLIFGILVTQQWRHPVIQARSVTIRYHRAIPPSGVPSSPSAFHHHGHPPPGNPPRNSALQTGSDPCYAIAFIAVTRGRKSRFLTRYETLYGFHPANRWIFLSTLLLPDWKKRREFLHRQIYGVLRA